MMKFSRKKIVIKIKLRNLHSYIDGIQWSLSITFLDTVSVTLCLFCRRKNL